MSGPQPGSVLVYSHSRCVISGAYWPAGTAFFGVQFGFVALLFSFSGLLLSDAG